MLKRFTDFILRSRFQAMGLAFALAFIPLVGTVSILIAAFITLRRGAGEGFLLLIAAAILPTIILCMGAPAGEADSLSATDILLAIGLTNVLTWVFAVLLRRFGSWNMLLQTAAVLSLVTVLVVHLINPDVQQMWQTRLTNYFTYAMQTASDLSAGELTTQRAMISRVMTTLSPFATGFVTMFVVFYALLQVLLARWWQAAIYNPGGLRKELCEIRLSYAAGIVCIAGFALSFIDNKVISDMMPVMYFTFSLAGFSILHVMTSKSKTGWFWNCLVYIAMIVMPISMALIAALGLLDTFFDLRRRISKKQI
jgi:uncharacterized protein YybS (DUF2232 family)